MNSRLQNTSIWFTLNHVYGNVYMYVSTVYPKKYAHGFCFAVFCCGYTLTDFPISIRLISLALWQSNDCPSASKATLMNMDKYFIWIHYERLHNHNKAKHNNTVCIFLGIYCMSGANVKARLMANMYSCLAFGYWPSKGTAHIIAYKIVLFICLRNWHMSFLHWTIRLWCWCVNHFCDFLSKKAGFFIEKWYFRVCKRVWLSVYRGLGSKQLQSAFQ